MRACPASSSRWRILDSPITSLVTSTSRMPAATNTAASLTFWQQMPTAPSATWRRAISGHLWLLAWGRRRTLPPASASAMRCRLRSKAGRSSTSAGVSMALTGSPGCAAFQGLMDGILNRSLAPENLTILAHLAVSRRDSARNSSGVLGSVSAPSVLKRSRTTGLASAVRISVLSLATMSLGMLAGPTMPPQAATSKPGTVFGNGRHVRIGRRALRRRDPDAPAPARPVRAGRTPAC